MTEAVLAALVGLVGCAAGGALVPLVVRRLPEPPPDPEPEEGVELTPAQRQRRAEPPKVPYADLGRRPRLALGSAVVSGAAGAGLGVGIGWEWLLCVALPLVPVGTLLGYVDWRTKLLPSVVVLPATGFALGYGLVRWAATGDPADLLRGVISMLVVRTVFWVLWFVRQAGMGFGDVRLSALIGLVLGYAGGGAVLVGLYTAFLVFAVPGVAWAVIKRDRTILRRPYPFGPFLLVGTWVGLALAEPVAGAVCG